MKRTPVPTRARADVSVIAQHVADDLATVRTALAEAGPSVLDAVGTLETFAAVALRVLSKVNPSKIRSEARTTEISHLMRELTQ